MNPLIQDILRRHLSLPASEQPENPPPYEPFWDDPNYAAPQQRAGEGSHSERDLGGPPWRCPNCHRLNTNERKRCKQCGSRKPNQTLCEVFAEEETKD